MPKKNPTSSRRPRMLKHIHAVLSERLAKEVYTKGQFLPSLGELAKDFNVDPRTVRRAITLLEKQGYLETCGKGVIVNSKELRRNQNKALELSSVLCSIPGT